MTNIYTLPIAEEMLLHRRIELQAKGYPDNLIEAAIRRSRGWAKKLVEPLPPKSRSRRSSPT